MNILQTTTVDQFVVSLTKVNESNNYILTVSRPKTNWVFSKNFAKLKIAKINYAIATGIIKEKVGKYDNDGGRKLLQT